MGNSGKVCVGDGMRNINGAGAGALEHVCEGHGTLVVNGTFQ